MTRPVHYLSLGALALVLALAAPNSARAQLWWSYQPNRYDYAAAWNFNRAYHHFMASPYSFRTYSTTTPGYAASSYTPYYGYQAYVVGPGYVNQQITPYGYQGYYGVPAQASYTVTPYAANYSYTPNYGYSSYAPISSYSTYYAPNYGYYP
jgi:hypothetical protein